MISIQFLESPLNPECNSRFDWFAGVLVVAAPDSAIGGEVEALFSRRGAGCQGWFVRRPGFRVQVHVSSTSCPAACPDAPLR